MPKNSFIFSRSQKIGVAGLSIVVVVLIILLNIPLKSELTDPIKLDSSQVTFFDFESDENEEASFSSGKTKHENPQFEDRSKIKLFNFDPNTLNQDGFVDLGFSGKQAESIINYRKQYGAFKEPSDFGKLYVVSEKKYEELKPYIQIDHQSFIIDINRARPEELEQIKGIGPKLAERLIKYRDALGGYSNKEQIKEVWGLDEETVGEVQNSIVIDQNKIDRINVNTLSKKELMAHPYIDFEMGALILKERDVHQLENLDFFDGQISEEKIERLTPYITYE